MKTINFNLNAEPQSIKVDESRSLLWVLRTDFGLTGIKYSCGEGYCGACTVLIDNKAERSCITTMDEVQGKSITTIEGLFSGQDLHPVQKAFIQHDAVQCGFCTPGMILTACDLLRQNPNPTREQVIHEMDNNLCRCGCYNRIVDAILTAADKLKGVKI
ncbi:(2Fe-2S)-binding protein [candidate division KSB1 bacterium]|nr:(2Fe-2S)-binding protein [candidate division KSB1 bacterium]